jgi:glucose dehydrogenase
MRSSDIFALRTAANYVVIAAGGGGFFGTKSADSLIAFALAK